jgi:hypothetical protein
MGTRNLVCVVKDGEFRVAQYGQWDGYPRGQGQTITEFLFKAELDHFKSQIDKVRHLSAEEVQARWKAVGADDTGWVTMDVSQRFKEQNAHLSRDCGADVLEYIHKADKPEVFMNLDFAGDSLFCEWAYVVNLDTDELEVYKGFNQEDLDKSERFAFLTKEGEEYRPVKLFKSIRFNDLTNETMTLLEKEAYSDEEQ